MFHPSLKMSAAIALHRVVYDKLRLFDCFA
jgi:hypothetical protein